MRSQGKVKDHYGIGRETTEDVYRLYEDLGLYLVCDGSRDTDGRWAAEAICERVHAELNAHAGDFARYKQTPTREALLGCVGHVQRAVLAACSEIYRASHIQKQKGSSSSALGVALILGDQLITAHVGNTRLYLLRAGKAVRLTRDHTYYEEMRRSLPAGSTVNPAFKKRLTRSIGDSESVPIETATLHLMTDDQLILCSNGFSDLLSTDHQELAPLCVGDPATLPNRLVDWALAQKSDDNITVVSIRVQDETVQIERAAPKPIARDARKQLELLKGLSVFRGLRDDERAMLKVQAILTFRHAQAGDVIVQQGSPSDEMFVVISGFTEVVVSGKKIAERGPGEVIGEMGFFDGRLRSATIRALGPTELMSIQRWEFDALVQTDWRLGYRILETVVSALAGKLEQLSASQPPAGPPPGGGLTQK